MTTTQIPTECDEKPTMKEPIDYDARQHLARNHWPHGKRGFVVHYVLLDYWTEAGQFQWEHHAKALAAYLLKEGKTVRISKTFECMELGEPITQEQFNAEKSKLKELDDELASIVLPPEQPVPEWAMTKAQHNALMRSDTLELTDDEKSHGYHFCHEFDGLLRTNVGEEFQCDCLKGEKPNVDD